jgi:hypothetical protein
MGVISKSFYRCLESKTLIVTGYRVGRVRVVFSLPEGSHKIIFPIGKEVPKHLVLGCSAAAIPERQSEVVSMIT